MPTSAPPSRLREAGMERPLAQRLRSRFVEQNGEVCVAKDVSGHIAWQAHDVPCRPEGLLVTLQEGFVALKEEFRKDGGLDERVEKWMEEVEEPVGDEVESREAAQPETTGSTEEQPPGEEEAVAAKTCDDVDMSFASWTMW
ncbi:uncharacterized protein CLAFUR5_04854 [Fulvia fulva]|uniref:Uncharacterized protein n=1 Tax=Passalora fulva TaxID=5499 RepID=A0A9Q8LFA2_PASFU|nr:uncharacterized protein CLAFUR5_04854 [Fulvia fulva]UJO16149.1 hypothetical protein CLAFUR5_04854 [Fulvia fulva]